MSSGKCRVAIIGGSGLIGGELLRLLLQHRYVEIVCVTSREFKGEYVFRVHPNLRGYINLRFIEPKIDKILKYEPDVVFLAVPHGQSIKYTPKLLECGLKVIDLSADFRLKDPNAYVYWYGWKNPHPYPDLLQKAVYGLPELHRDELVNAKLIAVPGCIATASILSLAPVVKNKIVDTTSIIIDVKIGSSGAGLSKSIVDIHSLRTYTVRPYKPTNHRHIAEIEQELSRLCNCNVKVLLTPHAIDIVRGIYTTSYAKYINDIDEPTLWKVYRSMYSNCMFIRIVKDRLGLARYPNIKYVLGTNLVDLGFEIDKRTSKLILFAAIDNLVRGGAGQAIQAFNISQNYPEDEGLRLIPIHPL